MSAIALNTLGSRLIDRLNPVLLREFRQLSRNKIVVTIIFLALAAFLITSGIYISFAISENSRGDVALEKGKDLFSLIATMLILSTFTFVPLYTAIRFGIERRKGRQDLMYTSSISPWQIVFGKTMTAAQLTLLIFSLALPFLSFTYLLRGVDLGNAALSIAVLFIGAVLGAQGLLLFTAVPMSLPFRIILSVLFVLPVVFNYYIIAPISFIWEGGFKEMFSDGFNEFGVFAFLSYLLILMLTISGTLFTMTSALIAPPSSNRALLIRSFTSVAAIVLIATTALCLRGSDLAETIDGLTSVMFVFAALALIATAAESDIRSMRVGRAIPKNLFKRILVYPLFQGRINGILWALISLIVIASINLLSVTMQGEDASEDFIFLFSITLYTLGYTLISILIQRKLLARRFNTAITPVITGLIFFLMALVPFLYAFFKGNLMDLDNIWSPLSPIDGSYTDHATGHLIGSFVVTVIGIVANTDLIFHSIKSFHPLRVTAPSAPPLITPPAETPPVSPPLPLNES